MCFKKADKSADLFLQRGLAIRGDDEIISSVWSKKLPRYVEAFIRVHMMISLSKTSRSMEAVKVAILAIFLQPYVKSLSK